MNSNTRKFTQRNFQSEVLDRGGVVLVDAYADWCGPCRALAPVIDELADEFAGRAEVGKLDVDEAPETAATYGIASIPTVLVFSGGELVTQLTGLRPKSEYAAAVESAEAALARRAS